MSVSTKQFGKKSVEKEKESKMAGTKKRNKNHKSLIAENRFKKHQSRH